MSNLLILLMIGVVLIISGCVEDYDAPVACKTDAKQCPDGSFVGRVPPDCEFKACPKDKFININDINISVSCITDNDCTFVEKDDIKTGGIACGKCACGITFINYSEDKWISVNSNAFNKLKTSGPICRVLCVPCEKRTETIYLESISAKCIDNVCIKARQTTISDSGYSDCTWTCEIDRNDNNTAKCGYSCSNQGNWIKCAAESRCPLGESCACITLYDPVCGRYVINGEIILKTYSNSCFACVDSNVESFRNREC